jgi:hypothetical protein
MVAAKETWQTISRDADETGSKPESPERKWRGFIGLNGILIIRTQGRDVIGGTP